MPQSINFLIAAFAFAMLVESFTEYFFAKIPRLSPTYLPWIALTLAIIVCVLYRIDILLMLLGITSPVPYVGEVMTGVLISRGANYLNDFVTSIGKPKAPVINNNVQMPSGPTTFSTSVINPTEPPALAPPGPPAPPIPANWPKEVG